MTTAAPRQAVAVKPPQSASAGLVLQRKCACGGEASGLTGECEECRKKKILGLQTKLRINEPGDSYEQEADRIAEQVLTQPAHPDVSSAPLRIQRFAGPSSGQLAAAPPSVAQALASPGRPLDPALRRDMEQRFGHDFSQVRVHADRNAAQSALDVDADAYSVGQHVVFSAGRYAPGTRDGKRLIAHELTHVVQQSGAVAGSGSPSGILQRRRRSDALPAQPDVDLVFLRDSEGAPSEADIAQARAPEAAPVPQPDSAELLGSPPQTSTLVPAAQPPGPQAPPTELDPGAFVSEARDAATEAGTPGNAILATSLSTALAAEDSSMPRLTDLLSQPQPQAVAIDPGAIPIEIASESGALDEVSQDSEVDRGALLGTLAAGASETRRIINSHSIAARSDIDRRAEKSSKRLEEQTKTADDAVRALAHERRTQIDKTILAHDSQIRWLEEQCKETAITYAGNAKKAQTDGFGGYRRQLADAFDSWVRSIEELNKEQSDRLTLETNNNANSAWDMAKNYDTRYIQSYGGQSEERKEVQHDAVYEVAEAYGTEIQKAKAEVLPELAKACAQVKAELDKARGEALVEFDKALPTVLSGIDAQLAAALQDISNKAEEVRQMLATVAIQMRKRVDFLEETALKRNAAFRTKIDGQIKAGGARAAQEFRRATPEAMEPIAAIVDEAVGILINSDQELDPDACRQFVEEVVDFSLGAADATGAVFAAARDASVGTLAGAVPFAKRGLAAGEQDFKATLHTEGAENEWALIDFNTEAEGYLNSSLTALDETFNAGVVEAEANLTSMLNHTRAKLREPMEKAEEQIRQSVTEALFQQNEARARLKRVMHNAARQAAWRYDHPYLKHVVDVIEVALGVAVVLGILVALVVGLPLLLGKVLAAVMLAIIGLVAAFAIGYFGAKAYDEQRKKNESPFSALLGAVAEVTGINDVRRAFTDSKMAPFERGMAWGGFLLNVFGLGAGASRFMRVIKVRLPRTFTNPFRLKRSTVPTIAPEAPVVRTPPDAPVIPETPKIGYELPHQIPEPEIPKTPTGPKLERIGFKSSEEPAATIDARPGQRDLLVPTGNSPASGGMISQMPRAREVPSGQRPEASVSGQPVHEPVRASADPADSPPPRASARDAPTAEPPTMGSVVSTVEPEIAVAARPVAAAPAKPAIGVKPPAPAGSQTVPLRSTYAPRGEEAVGAARPGAHARPFFAKDPAKDPKVNPPTPPPTPAHTVPAVTPDIATAKRPPGPQPPTAASSAPTSATAAPGPRILPGVRTFFRDRFLAAAIRGAEVEAFRTSGAVGETPALAAKTFPTPSRAFTPASPRTPATVGRAEVATSSVPPQPATGTAPARAMESTTGASSIAESAQVVPAKPPASKTTPPEQTSRYRQEREMLRGQARQDRELEERVGDTEQHKAREKTRQERRDEERAHARETERKLHAESSLQAMKLYSDARAGKFTHLSDANKRKLVERFEHLMLNAGWSPQKRNPMKGNFDEWCRTPKSAEAQPEFLAGGPRVPGQGKAGTARLDYAEYKATPQGGARRELANLKADNLDYKTESEALGLATKYTNKAASNARQLPEGQTIGLRYGTRPRDDFGPSEVLEKAMNVIHFRPGSPISEVCYGTVCYKNPNLP